MSDNQQGNSRTGTLDADHRQIEDDLVARRYFEKLRLISATLPGVLAEMVRDRLFTQIEVEGQPI